MTQWFTSYIQKKYTYTDLHFHTPTEFIAYCKWLHSIEEFVYHQTGLKLLDLPDQTYRNSYEEGISVNEMISTILSEVI